MTLKLKTINVSYTDNLENVFALNLYSLLKDYVNIRVITDYYSNVDYEITDKNNNNNKMYLELKSRSSNSYNTFIIGSTKIKEINKKYNPAILIWNFKDGLYFCKCIKDFDEYNTKIIKNSSVIEISKSICSVGIDNLKREILDILQIII
jgi:hypothetical protein